MNKTSARLLSLDLLRGILSFLIMIYHYNLWNNSQLIKTEFISKIGIYGVNIFYIISGVALYTVYHKKIGVVGIKPFLIKRIFRIYPLLWLVILLYTFVLHKTYSLKVYLLNFSGAFSMINLDSYIATGSWSIGNELFFYLILPLVLILNKKLNLFLYGFYMLVIVVFLVFGFFLLDADKTLAENWILYINPFHQLFFFVSGLLIGRLIINKKHRKEFLLIFIATIMLFIMGPFNGDQISIVTGINKIFYAILSIFLVYSLALTANPSNKVFQLIFKFIGNISYSVYLLHPIVFWYMATLIKRHEMPYTFIILCSLLTLFTSWVVFTVLEKNMIKLGKKLTTY